MENKQDKVTNLHLKSHCMMTNTKTIALYKYASVITNKMLLMGILNE